MKIGRADESRDILQIHGDVAMPAHVYIEAKSCFLPTTTATCLRRCSIATLDHVKKTAPLASSIQEVLCWSVVSCNVVSRNITELLLTIVLARAAEGICPQTDLAGLGTAFIMIDTLVHANAWSWVVGPR